MENRFSKIRSHSGRFSKIIAMIMAAAVAVTMLCATMVMAMVDGQETEQFKIELKNGDAVLQLNNTPFVYDNTVYLPLRELFEQIGIMDNEYSYITWDNGRIYICATEKVKKPDYIEYGNSDIQYLSYYCGLEIGKAEYRLNPAEILPMKKQFIQLPKEMGHAPVLKEGITYIPFEFVEYLVNRTMTTFDITCSVWDLAYNKDTDRKADYTNDSISIEYANAYNEFQYIDNIKVYKQH